MSSPSDAARSSPKSDAETRQPLLFGATFVSGASVMIVEVLGSRVLGPFFGVGLFVWSALLAVTLTALAIGYYVGGIISDRRGSLVLVLRLVLGAGCLVALVPVCSSTVLRFGDILGIRLGALLSAFVLFGPCLFVMGMITTTATRQAALLTMSGKAAGTIFSVSTLGGLAGTLLAGFVLVPYFSVNATLGTTSAVLVGLGLIGLYLQTRSAKAAAAVALPLLALMPPDEILGEGIRALERSESLLGRLTVVQDESRGTPLRLLRVDHSFIGGQWEGGEPAFAFVHLLEAVRLARPEGRRLLQIGLGIGSLSQAMAKVGVHTDAIEIDPNVVRLAQKYFAYAPTGKVHAEDARAAIRHLPPRTYDFIVHDTFTGGSVPEHLLSVEVLQRIRELLVPGGILALNVVGAAQGPLSQSVRAIDKTVRHVFPHVRLFRDGPPEEQNHSISNLVFFASSAPFAFSPTTRFESPRCEEVLTNFERWEVRQPEEAGAPIVTDARNPLARLNIPVTEAFRAAMNDLYPVEFWLR